MAYHHYETEGFIINYRNLGEAGRRYWILTDRFGLIEALAPGVRYGRSKLRCHLNNFSFIKLSLVRGRESWRVVGVNHLESPLINSGEIVIFLKKISLILQKLIHGEEKNFFAYQDLKQAIYLATIDYGQVPSLKNNLADLELFILSRLLTQLGYLAPLDELGKNFLVADSNFSWLEIKKVSDFRPLLVKQINKALVETQL